MLSCCFLRSEKLPCSCFHSSILSSIHVTVTVVSLIPIFQPKNTTASVTSSVGPLVALAAITNPDRIPVCMPGLCGPIGLCSICREQGEFLLHSVPLLPHLLIRCPARGSFSCPQCPPQGPSPVPNNIDGLSFLLAYLSL